MNLLVLGLLATALASTACGSSEVELGAAVMPGPKPPESANALEDNAKCERCHGSIADEWRSSRHHAAATNAEYLEAHGIEPQPFCQACHAPAAPVSETKGPLVDLGIGCLSCHPSVAGETLTGTTRHPILRFSHRAAHSNTYSRGGACASCHEFPFPSSGRDEPAFMQRTMTEHQRSPFANTTCIECHMPLTGPFYDRHRSHAFASTRDPSRLQEALRIEVTRTNEGLIFAIEPKRVGHVFPSGDLFRRLTLEARVSNTIGQVTQRQRRYLSRHFSRQRQTNGGFALVEVSDDRPGVACGSGSCATEFELALAAIPRHIPIEYDVVYERVRHLSYGSEDLAEIAERVVLARGGR